MKKNKNKNKNSQTVKSLRQSGYKVRVMHDRDYEITSIYKPDVVRCRGFTLVEVTTPDGKYTTIGISFCRTIESFNRKRGLTIALGRALSEQKGGYL
jgi:hypothetical protein